MSIQTTKTFLNNFETNNNKLYWLKVLHRERAIGITTYKLIFISLTIN